MNVWPRKIYNIERFKVIKYCVNDFEWQRFRINTLKGKTTQQKLDLLDMWYKSYQPGEAAHAQVNNYLGALKRGGQIDANGKVLK